MKVGCIGSRDLSRPQLQRCWLIGELLARRGYQIRSGNAVGADQSYASGANSIDPSLVTACLPWLSYESRAIHGDNYVAVLPELAHSERTRLYDEAARLHPAWDRCGRGARALHARNGLIVDGCALVLAWPRSARVWGGTGQGMRVAQARGVPMINLAQAWADDEHFDWADELARTLNRFETMGRLSE